MPENKPKRSAGGAGGHGPMGGAPGEKAKDFKGTWVKLIRYCKSYLPAIVAAIVFAMAGTIFSLIGPNKLSDITNLIKTGFASEIDLQAIADIGLLLTILYVLGTVLSYAQGYIMATVTQRITLRLRTQISEKINRLPLRYFDSTSFGDVLSRVTNDVDTIGMTLNQSVGTLVTAVTMFFGSLIMMFVTDRWMSLAAILSTIIGFVFMMLIIGKSQKYFTAQQDELGAINGHIEEMFTGHIVVKTYNGEAESEREFADINNRLYQAGWRAQFMSGLMMPLMGFVGNLGYVAVCVVGGALALKGSIGFGAIVAFMIYVRLFTQPLSQMAQAATTLQSAAAAGERVFHFLDEEEMTAEPEKQTSLSDVHGDVEFRNVCFGYAPEKTIIHNFSAHAKAGQKIAIVGPTGAGKTTIVNLLMRFYEVNSGEILIDGIPTTTLTREAVHDQFCMVLQDTWLFEGTIRENIVYSKQNVTDEDVIRACKAVGLHHYIKTLPDAYNTVLNDKASLSAGQKQLITIARAMIENAPLLILDEATSSVDTRTEVLIQEAMDRLMVGRTSFVIAHRLSTIRNADLILVMRDGDIVESGNHEALLAQGGFYAELYNSQFEKVS